MCWTVCSTNRTLLDFSFKTCCLLSCLGNIQWVSFSSFRSYLRKERVKLLWVLIAKTLKVARERTKRHRSPGLSFDLHRNLLRILQFTFGNPFEDHICLKRRLGWPPALNDFWEAPKFDNQTDHKSMSIEFGLAPNHFLFRLSNTFQVLPLSS